MIEVPNARGVGLALCLAAGRIRRVLAARRRIYDLVGVAVDSKDKPLTPIVIESAEIFTDQETGVFMLKAAPGSIGGSAKPPARYWWVVIRIGWRTNSCR